MSHEVKNYKTLFDLDGRVALVIGGGSGIGREAARAMAAHGARCMVADLSLDGAVETVAAITGAGGRAEAFQVDVTSTPAVDALVAAVLERHGRIDVLLTTPARNLRKRLADYTDAEFDSVIDLNLKATFRVARAVAKPMTAQRAGSIILMSSMRALSVEPGQSIYASTKAGIVQMANALATELAPFGVRVNTLAPGIVETPLTRPITSEPKWNQAYASRTALGRWAHASEMAGPIVFLASDASSYVTATMIRVDAGWTAIDGRYTPPIA
ncbi:MAG: SDR family NAD(P)-dependent oxidoreductase [Proteobacteria bacterium]|nr:SDR family NAD(P)-dependent oxidoreductase [Pseudomonadota bacterium]